MLCEINEIVYSIPLKEDVRAEDISSNNQESSLLLNMGAVCLVVGVSFFCIEIRLDYIPSLGMGTTFIAMLLFMLNDAAVEETHKQIFELCSPGLEVEINLMRLIGHRKALVVLEDTLNEALEKEEVTAHRLIVLPKSPYAEHLKLTSLQLQKQLHCKLRETRQSLNQAAVIEQLLLTERAQLLHENLLEQQEDFPEALAGKYIYCDHFPLVKINVKDSDFPSKREGINIDLMNKNLMFFS
jgi:hypothetical protein